MKNMSKIIKGQNKNVTWKPSNETRKYSCRKRQNVQWKGTVKLMMQFTMSDIIRSLAEKVYLRLAQREWKSRFYKYKLLFETKEIFD